MKKIKVFFTALMLLVTTVAFAQKATVKGKITDGADGSGVAFANVVEKGTTNGVSTDADGNYSIQAATDGVLEISSVGYKTLDVQINNRAVVNAVLEPDAEMLDQTIVVAFGTSTKQAFTGSAAVVDEKTIEKSQVSSVTNALAGSVAGVQLTSSNGAPGSTSTIRIRGFSSLNAGNDPLIIVDGAPYGGDLSNIPQQDVESMTVLKDAASSALYGARGANGVILITTKRAKRGEAVVTFDAKVGANTRAVKRYQTISDPGQYLEVHGASFANYLIDNGMSAEAAWKKASTSIELDPADGGVGYGIYTVPSGQYLFNSNGKLNPNVTLGRYYDYNGERYQIIPDNWEDYAYRTGLRQEYNVNVAAANERSSFYASVGYIGNQGITVGSDLSRLSGRLRADYQAKDWLKVGANMSFAKYDSNSLGNNGNSSSTGNVFAFTSRIAPIYPLYVRLANGTIKKDANGFDMMDYGDGMNAGLGRPFLSDANALMDNLLNTKNAEGNQASANAFMDITFCKGLKLTVNGTYNLDETRYTYVYNPYYGQFKAEKGLVEKEHSRYTNYNLQQILKYDNTFGKNTIGLMFAHDYYNAATYDLYASKNNMFNQTNKELNGAVVDKSGSGSSISRYNNEGYIFQAQYDYDNKIFASASYRRDASSRFAPAHRWGNFWSLGGAWIISKENWFNAPWVDELKLKASIGSVGNDNIGSYLYTDTFDLLNSDGTVATQFNTKGKDDITWETNTNFNAGAEFSFFKGRLSGSLEFFNRKTTNMLFSFSVAPSMGYSFYYDNVGNMRNNGLELELNGILVDTKNVHWDVFANITYVKNRITMLHPDKKSSKEYDLQGNVYEGYSTSGSFIAEGLSMYTHRLKEYAGVDPATGKSLWYKIAYDENGKFKETTKVDDWNEADYFVTGKSGIAPVYGGFGTSIDAYGFDFSVKFSYQLGGSRYDNGYAAAMASPTSDNTGNAIHVDILKSWSKTNTTEEQIPRLQWGDLSRASTRFLISGSYLNIENVNFGYTFPQKWTKKLLINSLRVYCAMENLGYLSARQGFDPRQGYRESGDAYYSPMKTISGGVTIKF